MDKFLTTAEVAELLRVSPETLRDWVKQDCAPPHIRVNRRLLFPESELQTWLREGR